MTLLVVAYPELELADDAWIQTLRRQHDPHYTLIAPHFTIVFPFTSEKRASFIEHVSTHIAQVAALPFVIRCAVIVKDAFSPLTHVLLVPDEGYSALIKLHDTLYVGLLTPALRLDIPFIPHITIGAHTDANLCKRIADQINRQDLCIRGRINMIDIISHDRGTVERLKTIQLAQQA